MTGVQTCALPIWKFWAAGEYFAGFFEEYVLVEVAGGVVADYELAGVCQERCPGGLDGGAVAGLDGALVVGLGEGGFVVEEGYSADEGCSFGEVACIAHVGVAAGWSEGVVSLLWGLC